MKKIFLLALVAVVCIADISSAAERRFMSIGTGGITGVYYPSGGAICRLINRGRRTHGIRCSVESTGGSIYNLNAIKGKELDIGFAQADWVYHATHGTSIFKKQGKQENLRSILQLHTEAFTVVARKDANIKSFADLQGKRVSIGNPGSGQRATMQALMKQKGWTKRDFKLVAALKASEQSQALCDNKIDAMVYAVGHPSGSIQEAATTCETNLVSVADEDVDKLIAEMPYYEYTIIPGGMYSKDGGDIKTLGMKAVVVSAANVDEDVVYTMVKAVFDNFNNFKTLHPVFSTLKPETMIPEADETPIHRGALKYYNEKGWMKAKAKTAVKESSIKEKAVPTETKVIKVVEDKK